MTFADFLHRLHTWHPAHTDPQPVPDWPYINRLAQMLSVHDRLLVLKSRQMMVTWIGCAYILHRAITGGPGLHLVISKEERSAWRMIERIQFLIESMPRDAVNEKVKLAQTSISFPERDVRILSLPAAKHAVRGLSPATVFWDEMAFTHFDEEIWTGVKPAVDSGGRFLGVSTPDKPSGVFHRLINDTSGAFTVFRIHFKENPERDSDWESKARAGLSEAKWRREYELSFEGAEGRVYDQFDRSAHILTEPFVPGQTPGARLYRGIDFGYRRPAVVWVEIAPDSEVTVFADLLGDRWPLETLMERIHATDARFGLREQDFAWSAVDPAGDAKTDYGISPAETMRKSGFNLVHRVSSISSGVETLRLLLRDAAGKISLRIDPRCTMLREAFESYAWDTTGEVPEKDGEHDHPMDALRYLVVNLPKYRPPARDVRPLVRGMKG